MTLLLAYLACGVAFDLGAIGFAVLTGRIFAARFPSADLPPPVEGNIVMAAVVAAVAWPVVFVLALRYRPRHDPGGSP